MRSGDLRNGIARQPLSISENAAGSVACVISQRCERMREETT